MRKQFGLEVYRPGSDSEVAALYESDQPFSGVSVGDLIKAGSAEEASPEGERGFWEVARVGHALWHSRGIAKQKVMVYTKPATRK